MHIFHRVSYHQTLFQCYGEKGSQTGSSSLKREAPISYFRLFSQPENLAKNMTVTLLRLLFQAVGLKTDEGTERKAYGTDDMYSVGAFLFFSSKWSSESRQDPHLEIIEEPE